jgi:hypothetical protein
LNSQWNLILRTIVPITYQDELSPGFGSQFGLNDTTQSLFLSPQAAAPGGLIWSAGPAFLWPTATEDELGAGRWGAGPTAVALGQAWPVDRGRSRESWSPGWWCSWQKAFVLTSCCFTPDEHTEVPGKPAA